MFDVITFGSASQDIFVLPKHITALKYEKSLQQKEVCFPFGSKIDVQDILFHSGGGGTNTAATFALQGFKVAYCGVTGSDMFGLQIAKELKKRNISTSLLAMTTKKATNQSIIIANQNQDSTILAYRGASDMMDKSRIPWAKLKTAWLYLAPLSGLLCDNFEDLVSFAKEHKVKVAANPGLAQLSLARFADIALNIDILFLNEEEASFLTKIPREQQDAIFKKIDAMCPGIAVMTRGAEGVMVSDGTHLYSAKPHMDREIVETTGAGDAFASGFVSEYMRTQDIGKSIQLGMANSAGCLGHIGAKPGLLKKGQEYFAVEVSKKEINTTKA